MRKFILSLAAIMMIMMLAACSDEEENTDQNEEESITSVEIEEVSEGDLVIDKTFYGRTEPEKLTPIMVQTPGEIDSLEVDEGDEVEEDDLIAKFKTAAGTQNIRAPEDGTVVNLAGSEGAMVSGEDPFAFIANMETMKLSFDITTTDHSLFKKEDKRTVELEGEEYEAEIIKVGSMPGETGLFQVQAEVNNEDGDILPGTVGKINIPEHRMKDSILVPTEAIVESENETFVFVVKDDQATQVNVEVQESQSDITAVDGDLQEGDKVVTKGQLTLSDGSSVNVVEAGE